MRQRLGGRSACGEAGGGKGPALQEQVRALIAIMQMKLWMALMELNNLTRAFRKIKLFVCLCACVFVHKPRIYPSCNLQMSLVKFTVYLLNTCFGSDMCSTGPLKMLEVRIYMQGSCPR